MIHASSAEFGPKEREYVLDCLNRNWITQGKYVRAFEEEFARAHNARYAVACSNGTAALHLSMLALGIGPGSTVTVPALTYIATANAPRYCGAKVRFADVMQGSWVMDPYDGNILLPDRLSAVIPVDLYDTVADLHELPYWVPSVLDASHTVGSYSHESSPAQMATFSFYASKVIACGEGGMVVTDDKALDTQLRLFRGQGAITPGRYHHLVVGYNYRMTDLQAAIGLAQLERLPEILAARRTVVNRYRTNLGSSPVTCQGGDRASGWMLACLLPRGVDPTRLANNLHDVGIETRPMFEPLPSLPPYYENNWRKRYPISTDIADRGICLPTHAGLSMMEVDQVCDELDRFIREVAA